MTRWIRRGLIAAAALAVVAAGTVLAGTQLAERRMNRLIDVQPRPVALRSDAAAIERGRYLYGSRGCADCHGADGAGRSFVQAEGLHLAGPNISPGAGSADAADDGTRLDFRETVGEGRAAAAEDGKTGDEEHRCDQPNGNKIFAHHHPRYPGWRPYNTCRSAAQAAGWSISRHKRVFRCTKKTPK